MTITPIRNNLRPACVKRVRNFPNIDVLWYAVMCAICILFITQIPQTCDDKSGRSLERHQKESILNLSITDVTPSMTKYEWDGVHGVHRGNCGRLNLVSGMLDNMENPSTHVPVDTCFVLYAVCYMIIYQTTYAEMQCNICYYSSVWYYGESAESLSLEDNVTSQSQYTKVMHVEYLCMYILPKFLCIFQTCTDPTHKLRRTRAYGDYVLTNNGEQRHYSIMRLYEIQYVRPMEAAMSNVERLSSRYVEHLSGFRWCQGHCNETLSVYYNVYDVFCVNDKCMSIQYMLWYTTLPHRYDSGVAYEINDYDPLTVSGSIPILDMTSQCRVFCGDYIVCEFCMKCGGWCACISNILSGVFHIFQIDLSWCRPRVGTGDVTLSSPSCERTVTYHLIVFPTNMAKLTDQPSVPHEAMTSRSRSSGALCLPVVYGYVYLGVVRAVYNILCASSKTHVQHLHITPQAFCWENIFTNLYMINMCRLPLGVRCYEVNGASFETCEWYDTVGSHNVMLRSPSMKMHYRMIKFSAPLSLSWSSAYLDMAQDMYPVMECYDLPSIYSLCSILYFEVADATGTERWTCETKSDGRSKRRIRGVSIRKKRPVSPADATKPTSTGSLRLHGHHQIDISKTMTVPVVNVTSDSCVCDSVTRASALYNVAKYLDMSQASRSTEKPISHIGATEPTVTNELNKSAICHVSSLACVDVKRLSMQASTSKPICSGLSLVQWHSFCDISMTMTSPTVNVMRGMCVYDPVSESRVLTKDVGMILTSYKAARPGMHPICVPVVRSSQTTSHPLETTQLVCFHTSLCSTDYHPDRCFERLLFMMYMPFLLFYASMLYCNSRCKYTRPLSAHANLFWCPGILSSFGYSRVYSSAVILKYACMLYVNSRCKCSRLLSAHANLFRCPGNLSSFGYSRVYSSIGYLLKQCMNGCLKYACMLYANSRCTYTRLLGAHVNLFWCSGSLSSLGYSRVYSSAGYLLKQCTYGEFLRNQICKVHQT